MCATLSADIRTPRRIPTGWILTLRGADALSGRRGGAGVCLPIPRRSVFLHLVLLFAR